MNLKMRMRKVEPKVLCRQHLLGEHKEMHMFIGSLMKGISISGYIQKGFVEPMFLYSRHKMLANEMKRRGYNHNSPLDIPTTAKAIQGLRRKEMEAKMDEESDTKELLERCPECKRKYEELTAMEVEQ